MTTIRIILACLIIVPCIVLIFAGCVAMWAWIVLTDPLSKQD